MKISWPEVYNFQPEVSVVGVNGSRNTAGMKKLPESSRSCRSWCPPVLAFVLTLGMALVSHPSPGTCVPTAGTEGTVQSWEALACPWVCYSNSNLTADGGRVWERPTVDKRDV